MKKKELYHELFIESYKSYFSALTQFKRAKEVICSMKCDYIGKKIQERPFLIDDIKCMPILVKADLETLSETSVSMFIYYAADPDYIKDHFVLTRREIQLLNDYKKKVYRNIIFNCVSQNPSNSELCDLGNEYDFQLSRLTHGIFVIKKAFFMFSLSDLIDDNFIEQVMFVNKKPLWGYE